MMSRSQLTLAGRVVLFTALAVLPAAGQGPLAVGGRASTLGFGGEAAFRVAGPLAIRVAHTRQTISRDEDIEGIDFHIDGRLQGTMVGIDLHQGNGAFRLSGGLVVGTPEIALTATNAGSMTIGGRDYSPGEVGELVGSIRGKKNAPYLAIGLDRSVFSRNRVSAGFEVGLVSIGTPNPTYTATTTLTGAERAELDEGIEQEVRELRESIADLPGGAKYFPLIGVTLKIRF